MTIVAKSNKHKRCSIVIPCYNVGEFVHKTLDSLFRQTHDNLQIVCVNDGSSDNTAAVLEYYARTSKSRLIILHNSENRGDAFTRNAGVRHTNGEYLYFLDADDTVENVFVEHMLELLEQYKADIGFFGRIEQHTNNEWKQIPLTDRHLELNEKETLSIADKIFLVDTLSAVTSARIYRTSFYKQNRINYPEQCVQGSDNVVFWQSILAAKRICCSYELFWNYHYRKESLSNVLRTNPQASAVWVIEARIADLLQQSNQFTNFRVAYAKSKIVRLLHFGSKYEAQEQREFCRVCLDTDGLITREFFEAILSLEFTELRPIRAKKNTLFTHLLNTAVAEKHHAIAGFNQEQIDELSRRLT